MSKKIEVTLNMMNVVVGAREAAVSAESLDALNTSNLEEVYTCNS